MLLWRLSTRQYANIFDGGYGLLLDGRWNTAGHAVTYCATSPSLCVLEKLVHIEDPALLPELVMVTYRIPDSLSADSIELTDLPIGWQGQESVTQSQGNAWHRLRSTPLLNVPSAIVPLKDSPDWNVLINHTHPESATIKIASSTPFVLDARLL